MKSVFVLIILHNTCIFSLNCGIVYCFLFTLKRTLRYILLLEGDGKLLESTLNRKSPGNIFFLLCDVTKEEDIKVGF